MATADRIPQKGVIEMPETIRKIDLSELKVVQIICKHPSKEREPTPCGTVIEVPIEKLTSLKICPSCEGKLLPIEEVGHDPFKRLIEAFNKIRQYQNLGFQFVLTESK